MYWTIFIFSQDSPFDTLHWKQIQIASELTQKVFLSDCSSKKKSIHPASIWIYHLKKECSVSRHFSHTAMSCSSIKKLFGADALTLRKSPKSAWGKKFTALVLDFRILNYPDYIFGEMVEMVVLIYLQSWSDQNIYYVQCKYLFHFCMGKSNYFQSKRGQSLYEFALQILDFSWFLFSTSSIWKIESPDKHLDIL